MNVITAFVNTKLEEDVSFFISYQYEVEICKLKKSIYGKKYVSRA